MLAIKVTDIKKNGQKNFQVTVNCSTNDTGLRGFEESRNYEALYRYFSDYLKKS